MYDESFGQRYIDSYSFFPMALAKMPVALDLTTTEKRLLPPSFQQGGKRELFRTIPRQKVLQLR